MADTADDFLYGLADETKAEIKKAIEAGEFPSVQAVINQALNEWHFERRMQDERYRERLRQLVQEGIDSGSAGDVFEVLDKLEREIGRKNEES
jgi:Arc/MetJ-type ribon-helix-helix transcriptional regulator